MLLRSLCCMCCLCGSINILKNLASHRYVSIVGKGQGILIYLDNCIFFVVKVEQGIGQFQCTI